MSRTIVKDEDSRTARGRPRVLSREEILDGAVELGLEGITMRKLSDHLKVGTGTLYHYFKTREALLRAAAVHALTDMDLPEDNGQHWSRLARDYVYSIQTALTDHPSFILNYQPTEYGFEVHFQLAERFLASMTARKFSTEDGMKVFHVVGLAAFGGAIEEIRRRELKKSGATIKATAKKELNRLNKADYPNLSEAFNVFTFSPKEKTDLLLRSAFKPFADARGEKESELF